jgi:hypothetical protein
MNVQKLFDELKSLASQAVWSKGIEISRSSDLHKGAVFNSIEKCILIKSHFDKKLYNVLLNFEEQFWQCDCHEDNDPCTHVTAAIIAIKNGLQFLQTNNESQNSLSSTYFKPEGIEAGYVHYDLFSEGLELRVKRYIVQHDKKEVLNFSLLKFFDPSTSLIRTLKDNQQHPLALPEVSREDLQIELLLQSTKPYSQKTSKELLSKLSSCHHVSYLEKKVDVSREIKELELQVVDDEDRALVLVPYFHEPFQAFFLDGAVLINDILYPVYSGALQKDDLHFLFVRKKKYSISEYTHFLSEVLPRVKQSIEVHVLASRFPKVCEGDIPRLIVDTARSGTPAAIKMTPKIVYGDPPYAEITQQGVHVYERDRIPLRDHQKEAALVADFQDQFGIPIDMVSTVSVGDFLKLGQKLRARKYSIRGDFKEFSEEIKKFEPRLFLEGNSVSFSFHNEGESFEENPARVPQHFDGLSLYDMWRSGDSYIYTDDGFVKLPEEWFEIYGERIRALFALQKQHSGILPSHALYDLHTLYEDGIFDISEKKEKITSSGSGASLASIILRMKEYKERAEHNCIPADVTATLRAYQKYGISWMRFHKETGLGCILADDMGLGKTLQSICCIEGKTLIVAPTSVVYTWEAELKKFRPNLTVCLYYGAKRTFQNDTDVIITSYPLLRLEKEAFLDAAWDTVILDESQTIKNPESQIAKICFALQSKFRLSLSGTPIENSLQDLWSQFNFINPGFLSKRKDFEAYYTKPITDGDAQRSEVLRKRVQPFILRRTKEEVLDDLPHKTEVKLYSEFNEDERTLYESLYLATKAEVQNQLKLNNVIGALESLLRLRQVCCHADLVNTAYFKNKDDCSKENTLSKVEESHVDDSSSDSFQSSKVTLLLDLLRESLINNHKCLVFSQWTSFLDIIETSLHSFEDQYTRLDGNTKNRDEVIKTFQTNPAVKIMLLSLKAGGVGLTLTAADHIYITDPWWNPAVEEQAAARAHRIGQKNPVFVHRLICKGSIEEAIIKLQEKKSAIAASVFQNASSDIEAKFSKEDILSLFEE